MDERIIVSVNGTPVSIFRGMKVKHALVAYDQSVFTSCERGRARRGGRERLSRGA